MAVQKSEGKSSIYLGLSVGSTTAGLITRLVKVWIGMSCRTGSGGGVLRKHTEVLL
jgi:hypothetical protein